MRTGPVQRIYVRLECSGQREEWGALSKRLLRCNALHRLLSPFLPSMPCLVTDSLPSMPFIEAQDGSTALHLAANLPPDESKSIAGILLEARCSRLVKNNVSASFSAKETSATLAPQVAAVVS